METETTSENISRWANVRLNEEEHQALEVIQKRLQTTRSRLLRKVVRELIGVGPDLLVQEWQVFEQLAYQLAAVGRNLNQLVRAIHTGKVTIAPGDKTLIEAVQHHVDRIEREVIKTIYRSHHRWVKDAFR